MVKRHGSLRAFLCSVCKITVVSWFPCIHQGAYQLQNLAQAPQPATFLLRNLRWFVFEVPCTCTIRPVRCQIFVSGDWFVPLICMLGYRSSCLVFYMCVVQEQLDVDVSVGQLLHLFTFYVALHTYQTIYMDVHRSSSGLSVHLQVYLKGLFSLVSFCYELHSFRNLRVQRCICPRANHVRIQSTSVY